MSKVQYIIRGIKLGQACSEADIGMNNIVAIGQYASVSNAKRYMLQGAMERAKRQGFHTAALFDNNGVVAQYTI